MEIKPNCILNLKILMPLEACSDIKKKSIILNIIQFDSMKTLISECEFYKNKTSLLEIQLLNTKIAYQNLIKDINDIVKEMNDLSKYKNLNNNETIIYSTQLPCRKHFLIAFLSLLIHFLTKQNTVFTVVNFL